MRRRLTRAGACTDLGRPAVGGLVTTLALPPFDLLPAVFVGLAVLALSLRDAPSASCAALRAGVWATAGGLVGLRFVVPTIERFSDVGTAVAVVALVLLAVVQSLGWAGGAALAHALRARAGLHAIPGFGLACLVGVSSPGVFTWTPAGLLAPRPELLQAADLVGERGVSVGLAMLAALAVAGRTRFAVVSRVLIAVLLLAAIDRAGAWRMERVSDRPVAGTMLVGMLDADAPARRTVRVEEQATRVARLRDLSAAADAAGAQLVVWPEGAYPIELDRRTRSLTGGTLAPVPAGARAPRLFGVRTVRREPGRAAERFNSAVVVSPQGVVEPPVDKRRLLWFGETVPLRGFLGLRGRLSPGEAVRGVSVRSGVGTVRLGVLICYEDVDPGPARDVARQVRPQLLVNVTNDAWFAGTIAPELQARLAAMRAIETRTALVRAVNAGGGGWSDATGRARPVAPVPDARGAVVAQPALRPAEQGATVYARAGDGPLWALFAAVIAACVLRRRTAARRELALSRRECQ